MIGPDIRGKSVDQIQLAIAIVPLTSFLSFLTIDEIELLASHLNTLVPISGKVAWFQSFLAEITIKDADGKTVRTISDPLAGEFYVEHSGLTPLLFAKAIAQDGEIELYGVAFNTGILYISSFSDLDR